MLHGLLIIKSTSDVSNIAVLAYLLITDSSRPFECACNMSWQEPVVQMVLENNEAEIF